MYWHWYDHIINNPIPTESPITGHVKSYFGLEPSFPLGLNWVIYTTNMQQAAMTDISCSMATVRLLLLVDYQLSIQFKNPNFSWLYSSTF